MGRWKGCCRAPIQESEDEIHFSGDESTCHIGLASGQNDGDEAANSHRGGGGMGRPDLLGGSLHDVLFRAERQRRLREELRLRDRVRNAGRQQTRRCQGVPDRAARPTRSLDLALRQRDVQPVRPGVPVGRDERIRPGRRADVAGCVAISAARLPARGGSPRVDPVPARPVRDRGGSRRERGPRPHRFENTAPLSRGGPFRRLRIGRVPRREARGPRRPVASGPRADERHLRFVARVPARTGPERRTRSSDRIRIARAFRGHFNRAHGRRVSCLDGARAGAHHSHF